MKGFKLYFYPNDSTIPVLFSQYTDDETSNITFNESLSENENDQYTLTFSIVDIFAKNQRFPAVTVLGQYLRIGRKLRLECENHESTNYIDFIISSISPEGKPSNIIYNITATDYFSYIARRNNIGLNLDSIEDGEWLDLELRNDLASLGNYILTRGAMQSSTMGSTITTAIVADSTFSSIVWPVEYIPVSSSIFTLNYKYKAFYDSGTLTSISINFNSDNKAIFNIKWYDTETYNAWVTWKYTFYFENGGFNYTKEIIETYNTALYQYLITENPIQKIGITDTYNSLNFVDGWEIIVQYNNETDNPINNIFNISLSDSNTYNALVELGYLVESNFNINYATKKITYKWKKSSTLYKNYQLSPNVNLESLSLTYNGEELYPLLFVEGGEDEYGINVGLTPTLTDSFINFDWESAADLQLGNLTPSFNYYSTIWSTTPWELRPDFIAENESMIPLIDKVPYLDNFILDLDYFKNNNLISDESYGSLFDLIYNDLRKINVRYQGILRKKYQLEYEISQIENAIDTQCEFMVKATTAPDKIAYNNYINYLFKEGVQISLASAYSSSNSLTYNSRWLYGSDEVKNFYFPARISPTIVINGTTIPTVALTTDNNGLVIKTYETASSKYKISFLCQVDSDAETKSTLITNIITDKQVSTISYSYIQVTGPTYDYTANFVLPTPTAGNLGKVYKLVAFDEPLTYWKVISKWGAYTTYAGAVTVDTSVWNYIWLNYRILSTTALNFKYFDLLRIYKGYNFIAERLEQHKQNLIEAINNRVATENEIEQIEAQINLITNTSLNEYKDLQYTLANKKSLYDAQKGLCGTWIYDSVSDTFTNNTNETSEIGKLNIIWQKFDENYDNYSIAYPYNEDGIINLDQIPYQLDTLGLEEGFKATSYTNFDPDTYTIIGLVWHAWSDSQEQPVAQHAIIRIGETVIHADWVGEYIDWYVDERTDNITFTESQWNEFWSVEDPLIDQYNIIKAQKEAKWYEIKSTYGQYLLEGYYSNDIESDSNKLYNQAILYHYNFKQPSDEYSISYLDISSVIGKNVNAIQVGDYITVLNHNLGILETINNEIQVISISRDLRKNNGISLTVNRIRRLEVIWEKMIQVK